MMREKYIKVYDKNGNSLELRESYKPFFVGKGFFAANPK